MNQQTKTNALLLHCRWALPFICVLVIFKHASAEETNPPTAFDLGMACARAKNWAGAISNFDETIRINPSNACAYVWRAGSCYALDDMDGVISNCTSAIQLSPPNDVGNFYTLNNRGVAYRRKGDFSRAILDFDECVRLEPTNSMAFAARGNCYTDLGKYAEAIRDLNQSLQINPTNTFALASRGWAYFLTGEFEKSIQDDKQAIRIDPNHDRAYNNLAWLRATCPVAAHRNGKEAVQAAEKACDITHWSESSWIDTLAAAQAELGDFSKAVKYQEQALDLGNPKDSNRKGMLERLSMYQQQKPFHDGQKQ